jgi:hypothetical protein
MPDVVMIFLPKEHDRAPGSGDCDDDWQVTR